MAELTFAGAAGTVTGSKHLLRIGERAILVDCGLYQGPPAIEALNRERLPVRPATIEAIVITHGHLDHVGYLPKIVRDGFHGPIYCTPATADVMEIVLEDAAHIQEHLRERGFHHERAHGLPPFYDRTDVDRTLGLVKPVAIGADLSIAGAAVRFHEAGHIIGAAFVAFELEGKRVVFSGDVGRYDRLLLRDPEPLDDVDLLVCEATYGDRIHPLLPLDALEATLLDALHRGGPIVIPAFAVERSQEVLRAIGLIQARNPAIAELPVHLDSPMAIGVDRLFARHRHAHKPLAEVTTFGCRNLSLHVTSEDSKRLNHLEGPAMIVASSGMANGGRVLYHLHRLLRDPAATIAFVGFQATGTLGRKLVAGANRARIFGDVVPVRATVVEVGGFSAHADQAELIRWLSTATSKPDVYLVHAEPPAAATFAVLVSERLGMQATVAKRGDVVRF